MSSRPFSSSGAGRARLELAALLAGTGLSAVVSLIVNLMTERVERSPLVPWLLLLPLLGAVYVLKLAARGGSEARGDGSSSDARGALYPVDWSAVAASWSQSAPVAFALVSTGAIVVGVFAAIMFRWPFEVIVVLTRDLSVPVYQWRYWILAGAVLVLLVSTKDLDVDEFTDTQIGSAVVIAVISGVVSLSYTGPEAGLRDDVAEMFESDADITYLEQSAAIATSQPELFSIGDADFSVWERKPRRHVQPALMRELVDRPDYYDGTMVALAGKISSVRRIEDADDDQMTPYALDLTSLDGTDTIRVKMWRPDPRDPSCSSMFVVVGVPVAFSEADGSVLLLSARQACVTGATQVLPGGQGMYAARAWRQSDDGPMSGTDVDELAYAVRGLDAGVGMVRTTSGSGDHVMIGSGPLISASNAPFDDEDVEAYCEQRVSSVGGAKLPCEPYLIE